MRSRSLLLTLLAAALVASACGDDGPASPSSSPVTTPLSPVTTASGSSVRTTAPLPPATTSPEPPTIVAAPSRRFDERGPYAVGVQTLDLGDRQTEVFYPTDADLVAGQPTDVFEAITVFPEAVQPLVPEALRASFDVGAVRDAPASAGGPFPVVVYSHGFGAYRQDANFHLAHLASWGFVVASTDHSERSITALATGTLGGGSADRDVATIRDTLTLLSAQNSSAGAILEGKADLEHVGITGHSAGAGTAVQASLALPEIDAFVSISGGPAVTVTGDPTGVRFASVENLEPGEYELTIEAVVGDEVVVKFLDEPGQLLPASDMEVVAGDSTVTLSTGDGSLPRPGTIVVSYAVPADPALVVFAADDVVVAPKRSKALYEDLGSPRYEVGIAGAGHASFTDACREILARGGIESLRPLIGDQVDRGQNGCTPGAVDPLLVQRVLDHYSTAFFLTYLAGQDETATLETDAVQEFGPIELSAFAAS